MTEGLLTARDEDRLRGVHPDLARLVRRARRTTTFSVIEGLRSLDRQRDLVARGASRTMLSRHLTGHAVDLAPIPLDWTNRESFRALADVMAAAAAAEGVHLKWGGAFRGFFDGPHFELPEDQYPA